MAGESVIKRLWGGAKDAVLMRTLGVALLFLMHALLGRAVGPDGYGTFSYAFALATLVATVALLGWHTAIIRFVAEYSEKRQWGLLRGALSASHRTALIALAPAFAVLMAASFYIKEDKGLSLSLFFSALLLPLIAFIILKRSALQGLRRVKTSILPEEAILPGGLIVAIIALGISSVEGALLAFTAAAALALAVSAIWLRRSLPGEAMAAEPQYLTRDWTAVAIPMALAGINQLIMNRVDVILLGLFSDMGSVGVYSAAGRLANLNVFVMTGINVIGAPMLASSYYGGRMGDFNSLMRKTMMLSMAGALPFFLVMVLWPSKLLGIFGPGFEQGAPVLQILALGQFVNASTGLVGTALVMTGRQKAFAWTTGACAVLNLAGNLALIPLWGAKGAAVATFVSVTVFNGALFYLVWNASLREARSGVRVG